MSSVAKRKRVRLTRGDIFEFGASDGRLGYGVVVKPGGVLDAIFLRTLHNSRPSLEVLGRDEIALIGTTMDALFFHGRWVVFAQGFPLPDDLPFPNWKVGMEGRLYTTDFDGRTLWPIRGEEADLLDYKSSFAPIRFQKALEAMNGVGSWEDHYERLTYAYSKRRVTRDDNGRYIARP